MNLLNIYYLYSAYFLFMIKNITNFLPNLDAPMHYRIKGISLLFWAFLFYVNSLYSPQK